MRWTDMPVTPSVMRTSSVSAEVELVATCRPLGSDMVGIFTEMKVSDIQVPQWEEGAEAPPLSSVDVFDHHVGLGSARSRGSQGQHHVEVPAGVARQAGCLPDRLHPLGVGDRAALV